MTKLNINLEDQNKSENDFNRVTQNEPIELDDLSFEDSEFSESKESGESEDCSMPSIKSNEERKVFLSQKAKTQKLLDILKEKMFQQRSVGELK